MNKVVLLQLPVPQTNFGRQTGNTPLAAAWLKASLPAAAAAQVRILPESIVSYLGDAALLDLILAETPDIVGFTVYCWNLDRSLHVAQQLKQRSAARIVFGGPEITPDNPRLLGAPVDFRVYGEGEIVFERLIGDPAFWSLGSASAPADTCFESLPSPYLSGLLEPGLSNVMLLETQRGCPYRCRYCYYNKARSGLTFASEAHVFDAVDWAGSQGIGEIYLLDPCLSARPRFNTFLKRLAMHNPDRRMGFVSEIRAESIDRALADLFQTAGFLRFEIGLQSTNPKALAAMNRRADLARLAVGAHLLKARGIVPQIDLILGLPGDDPAGFKRSVDFLVDNDLADDVQLFPLSLLPGTEFRAQSRSLGLRFTPAPPYTVWATPTFSHEEMLAAIDFAEVKLDAAFYPFADLNIAWRLNPGAAPRDVTTRIGEQGIYTKLYLTGPRTAQELQAVAPRLSHPYQLFVDPQFTDAAALCRVITVLSAANPFTPFEVVFLSPPHRPDRNRLLSAVRLKRPHFLDLEERFLYHRPGNRAVILTIVNEDRQVRHTGEMERQVFWWRHEALPTRAALDDLLAVDGVLIDTALPHDALVQWQDRFAPLAGDLPRIAFAHLALQHRWLLQTARDEWAATILDPVGRMDSASAPSANHTRSVPLPLSAPHTKHIQF